MSRNRYTSLIHAAEQSRVEQQIAAMARLEKSLARAAMDAATGPAPAGGKEQRRLRLEQKRRHKAERFQNAK